MNIRVIIKIKNKYLTPFGLLNIECFSLLPLPKYLYVVLKNQPLNGELIIKVCLSSLTSFSDPSLTIISVCLHMYEDDSHCHRDHRHDT